MSCKHLWKILCLITLLRTLECERLHEQIYSSIEGAAACFKRLNGTHQAGCSSSNNGAVGVVQIVEDVNIAQWIVNNATAGPYVVVVNTATFNDVIEIFLSQPDNVAGILLYDNITAGSNFFSQDSKCPNQYLSDSDSTCSENGSKVWNDKGTNLLRRDIPFPIFFLPNSRLEEIEKIKKCYERYNVDKTNQNGQPLCSIQLHSFMFAAVNSVLCMRRSATSAILSSSKVCDPLGDSNVYYSLFPRTKETDSTNKPTILVTARMDAASLFDGISPGAASSVVGLVTFIAAAANLAKTVKSQENVDKSANILWTLLNGEAFDYIGSQRLAYDISRGAWPPNEPLSPSDIKLHIEIGQIGGSLSLHKYDPTWPVYAFSPNTPVAVTDFLTEFDTNMNKNNTLTPVFTKNIPPSSLHSFRRILKNVTENDELPEVLLVDHNDSFTNMFYNSALDEDAKIGFQYHNISIGTNGSFMSTEELIANGNMSELEPQVKMARLATTLSRTLFKQATGTAYTGNLTVSAHMIDELLYCFLESQSCRMLMAADYAQTSEDTLPTKPAPMYVGVATWATNAAIFSGHLIALLAGDHLSVNQTQCSANNVEGYSYYWLRGWNYSSVCIQTTMNFSQAVSPAFILPDYDLTSGEYSSWTESVWQTMWIRVFVKASGTGARVAAIAGGVVTVVAAALTLWLRKHANVVFASSTMTDASTGILRTVNC